MPRRPTLSRRIGTAALWPVGIGLTSWNYMWRTTPMTRSELPGSARDNVPPPLAADVSQAEIQNVDAGVGPLFHRTYRVWIDDPSCAAEALMTHLTTDLNAVTPTELARFFKVRGERGVVETGDEFVVRMPGPWDGPVRVVERTPTSFRFVTLAGHLEAGQISFRVAPDERGLVFSIESWARSSDWLSNVLYHRLRMAKEVQLHMWTSFLENIVGLADGSRRGRVEIETRRIAGTLDG
ncbi:MAG: DUF1990 family protein [Gaiellaceae bacterium]